MNPGSKDQGKQPPNPAARPVQYSTKPLQMSPGDNTGSFDPWAASRANQTSTAGGMAGLVSMAGSGGTSGAGSLGDAAGTAGLTGISNPGVATGPPVNGSSPSTGGQMTNLFDGKTSGADPSAWNKGGLQTPGSASPNPWGNAPASDPASMAQYYNTNPSLQSFGGSIPGTGNIAAGNSATVGEVKDPQAVLASRVGSGSQGWTPNDPGTVNSPTTGQPTSGAQTYAPPAPGNAAPPGNSSATPYGDVTRNVNTSNVPALVGGDALAGQMHDAQSAAYQNAASYLDPQWQNQQDAMESKLANQGIPQNSEAWNKAMDDFGRQKEFAYSQARSGAVQQGNAAQSQLFNQGLMSNNSQFGQNLQSGQFSNAVQQQLASQGYSQQQIDNLEQQHRFDNSLTMRNQDINELLLQQQNPLQMLNSLNSGGQVQTPQFTNAPGANVNGTDIAGINNQAYQGGINTYNAQQGGANSLTSGLFGLGGAALMAPSGTIGGLLGGANGLLGLLSDRRAKTDITRVGKLDSGLPVYKYRYKGDPTPQIGVMADEVEEVRPDAVVTHPSGLKMVQYGKL